MRKGKVYVNQVLAGTLEERANGSEFVFSYEHSYYDNPALPAVSLTLPKKQLEYTSAYLFPFFANMLSEGSNRAVQAMLHHVDIDDDFGILLSTASVDTPGAVTIVNASDND